MSHTGVESEEAHTHQNNTLTIVGIVREIPNAVNGSITARLLPNFDGRDIEVRKLCSMAAYLCAGTATLPPETKVGFPGGHGLDCFLGLGQQASGGVIGFEGLLSAKAGLYGPE